MAWFSKKPRISITPAAEQPTESRPSRMEGLWAKCETCDEIIYRQDLEKNWMVCPHCEHHHYWPARARLATLLDPDSFEEFDRELEPQDPLGFSDTKKYKDRLKSTRKSLGEPDAFISGVGRIEGHQVSVGCFVFEFMGGSMGSVVGEKIARAIDYSLHNKIPFLMISRSGGARMMEAGFSLMQMAKTSAKLALLAEAKVPYVSLLTDPTTGGVTASYAMLGDFNIAEPGALIGFAGPRVIRETIGKDLPKDFQSAEFVLEHGFLDFIVDRKELKTRLTSLLSMLK